MTFPSSVIQFLLVALLVASVHVPAVPVDVPTDTDGSSSLASLVSSMTPNITSRGDRTNVVNKAGATPEKNQARGVKPGIPISNAHEFVLAHNKVRLGLGEPPLKWDKNLARYSRRFAAKRAADCKMLHSYGPYGENIFWGAQAAWSPSQVVDSWVGEGKFYDATHNSCAQGQMCGHYTQIVWRDTTRVGCAWVTCLNGGMYAICSYDPPGNYVNESPFSTYPGP